MSAEDKYKPYGGPSAEFDHLHVEIAIVDDGTIAEPVQPDGYGVGIEAAEEHCGCRIKCRNGDAQFQATKCEPNKHSDTLRN